MDRRHQIFIRSLGVDLGAQRDAIELSLFEMDCIPCGFGLQQCTDAGERTFARSLIDDSDYYLLVARSGPVDAADPAFACIEQECEHALSRGMAVALLAGDPADAAADDAGDAAGDGAAPAQREHALLQRLIAQGGHVELRRWRSVEELRDLVCRTVRKLVKSMPMKGWARGDAVLSLALLQELDTLRRQNLEARETLARAEERANAVVPDAAGLDQSCPMSGLYKSSYRGSPIPWSATLSFGEMFALLAPALLEMPVDALVKTLLTKAILERQDVANYTASIDEQPFATFKLQLKALGLVELKYLRTTQGEMGLFWSLTASGMQAMLQLRVVRKGGRDDQHAGRIDEAQRARSAASPRGPVR